MYVNIAPGGLDALSAEGKVVEVTAEERYPGVAPKPIGRVLERPCDVVRLPRRCLQLRLRRRVEDQAEVLFASLGEEDGDREAGDFGDREAALCDVTAGELDRWQIDRSKRASLPFAFSPGRFRRLLGASTLAVFHHHKTKRYLIRSLG